VLFVDYIAEHLTPDGRAAVIVPEGIIFQSGNAYKQLRKMLVEKYLVGVISLPAGVFNPYSGVKTSILWLDKSLAKKTDKILFVKIENDGFDLGAQRRAVKGNDLPSALHKISDYKNQINTEKLIDFESNTNILLITRSEISLNGDYSFSGDRYRINEILSSQYSSVSLGSIVEILDSLRRPITQCDRISGEYPYYGATGILDHVHEYIFSERLVLVGEDGAKWGQNEKSAFIADGRYWVNNHAHVLRPLKDKCIDTYLVEVLNFMDLKPFITGVTVPKLNQGKLREIQIPLPPLSIQEEIVEEIESYQKIIDGARQVGENYKPRIDIDPEWEMVELGEVCELATGGTPKSTVREYYEGGEIKWLVSGDIHKEEVFDCEGRITELGFKSSNAKYLPVNSVLIALNGQGRTRGTVALLRVKATCNQSLVAINPKSNEKLLPEFLYLQLKAKYQEIRNITGDDQRSGLNMPIIRGIKIFLPDISVQKELVKEFTEENTIVKSNVILIGKFEQRIKDRIAKVWGV